MRVVVKLFGEFRAATEGERLELDVPPGASCRQALQQLVRQVPAVGPLLFDDQGEVRDHLNVFVNGRNVSTLAGLDTELSPGDSLAFFPPVGGG
ncbi:MAG: ubiquitin-like small modifier protein 1 [Candidatus Bipolaricaulaceae bacterium]